VGVVWGLHEYWLALMMGMTRGKKITLAPWMANVLVVMILEPMSEQRNLIKAGVNAHKGRFPSFAHEYRKL